MTRRDYVRIAAALRGARPFGQTVSGARFGMHPAARQQWHADTDALADALAADNPRFDRARFLAAAGDDGEVMA